MSNEREERGMERPALTCAKCGGNEFMVEINYFIPRGINLSCKCGYITPIAVFSRSGKAYVINGKRGYGLYEEAYCRDIEDREAFESMCADMRENSEFAIK